VRHVHVRVHLGRERYAVPIGNVREVADVGEVAPVPGAPAGVLGVRNLRGQVLPVIDLAAVLGVAAEGPRRLLVAEDGDRRAGLAVDLVTDVETLPTAEEEASAPHLSGAALIDGELVGVVDVAALFDAVQGGRA
jgi:purine-binding chemotaxis protein CheW